MYGSHPLYLVLTAILLAGAAGESAAGPNHGVVPGGALSLMAGAHRFHRGQNLSNHFLLRAGYERMLTPHYGLETHITIALNALGEQPFPGQGAAVNVDGLLAGADFVFNLRPYRPGVRLLPFLAAGAEVLFNTGSGLHGDRTLFLGAATGAKYFLHHNLALQATLRLAGASFHSESEIARAEDADTLRIDTFTAGVSVLF